MTSKQRERAAPEVEYAPSPLDGLLDKPIKKKRAPRKKKAAKRKASKRRMLSAHERDMRSRRRIWGKRVHEAAKVYDVPQDTLLLDDITQRGEPLAPWLAKRFAAAAKWAAEQRAKNPGVDLSEVVNPHDPVCPKCGEQHYRLTCEAAE